MNIDYHKLTVLLLPYHLRKERILALFDVLVTSQLKYLNLEYQNFIDTVKLRASCSPSVCDLENILSKELEADIMIETLDGRPTDFMIRVDGSSDINQLQTIIDDYKASGRSYTFDIGDILYTCTYTDFVDEDYEESWTCEYQDHIYSDVEVCNIDVYLNDKMDATGVWCKYLIVSADYNIQDNIIVGATVVIGSQPTLYQVALSASRHYMEYRLYTHTIPMPIIYISSKTVKPQYTDYIYYSYGNNRK